MCWAYVDVALKQIYARVLSRSSMRPHSVKRCGCFFAPDHMADDTLARFDADNEYGRDLPCLPTLSAACTPTLSDEASTVIDCDSDSYDTPDNSSDSFDMDTPITLLCKRRRF